ncbi:DNA-binding response regulator [Paenibacillus oralis]|uniref:DNA-binding response regulator n=1 Tax=Paenibacillus oralis TaxID=2490856 RepID=A0A3P3UAM8_9BACL|nr:response regulator transcription factor [Paenibacillus oralis]RRJ67194.1 DNA-binding response regulator [Paenibacillus oralis]
MSQKILIVEDDINISNIIKMNLNLVNYETIEAYDGHAAWEQIQREKFDLVLLDVMIPGIDGFELMEKIRPLHIPVIFLTAKNAVTDKVHGLKLGAEDYIVKPFEALELLARIETVLRRFGREETVITFRDLQVLLDKREVRVQGKPVELTMKEFDLLVVLLKNKNIALSREQLLDKVWGIDFYGETRTVDMHIKALRKKLGLHDRIITVYKIGYRLED